MTHHRMNSEMQECIENCGECERVCHETVSDCLEKGGRHAEAAHVRLLLDCADICHTSAAFMARGSEHHRSVCNTCMDVCEACASSCARFEQDEMMRTCADMCRRCAESCRRMARMAA